MLIGRTSQWYHNLGACEKLETFQPMTFDDVNYNTGIRYHYEVSEDRCVKRERRTRIVRKPLLRLADFDITTDVEAEEDSKR